VRNLEGQHIVITRAVHQAEELASPLRKSGAEVILLPCIAIAPPSDPAPLRRAAAQANEYDWIIFTSVNAIAAFVAEMPEPPSSCQARVATIGAATRHTAEKQGFQVSLTPPEYVAESLLDAFSAENLNGRRVLIPSAAVTRDIIPGELRNRGAFVEVVEAYRNAIPPETPERAATIFREPYPHWVLFASSSAVESLVSLVGVERLRCTKIASIGPITSRAIWKHGLTVSAEASDHTISGLIEALSEVARMP